MTRLALTLFCTAAFALPAQAAERDLAVDCAPTEGGIACAIAWDTERMLYCMAVGRQGVPVAASNVSSDAGRAVFNRLRVDRVAAIRCREV